MKDPGCQPTFVGGYIGFRKISEPYGWLGNMSRHPIWTDDKTKWLTAEALFQAGRFADKADQEKIRACTSPMSAKMRAKDLVRSGARTVLVPRSEWDVRWMRSVLKLKIEQHPTLRTELLSTGDAILFENVMARPTQTFWGAILQDGKLEGENILGKLWMEIRDNLRRGSEK